MFQNGCLLCRDLKSLASQFAPRTPSRFGRSPVTHESTPVVTPACSAMGKSRSATVVCAYLMHLDRITSAEALAQVRQTRPFCEPNDGFMQQLDLYHETDMADELDAAPAYQRWLYRRELDLSRACGQAPEPDKIRFEDEHARDAASAELELRCRKCRRPLATSAFLVPHRPRAEDSATSPTTAPIAPSPNCAHYFLDPLAWMRPELEQGKLDGRLECPKCRTNVGKYAWHGMRCSCGDWLVPGISLAKGRVDEVRSRSAAASAAAGPGMGIRLPPTNATQGEGRRAGGGQENL